MILERIVAILTLSTYTGVVGKGIAKTGTGISYKM